MIYNFFVSGLPVPKQSFRYSKRGNYQPARLTDWQNSIAEVARIHALDDVLSGKLHVALKFYLHDERRRDLDNLSKGVLDAINGILWEDDKQVVKLEIEKMVYPECPGVEIFIEEIA